MTPVDKKHFKGYVWLISNLFTLAKTKGISEADAAVNIIGYLAEHPDESTFEALLTIVSNLEDLPDKQ